jgi:hypothetical protein
MAYHSIFHLDCTAIFPACQFNCARCAGEIQSTLMQVPGVAHLHLEGEGTDAKLIIAHDPSQVTCDQLAAVLERLPSFCRASFAPTVLG